MLKWAHLPIRKVLPVHLPNFCMRACQRSLQNNTLWPFSCNFFEEDTLSFTIVWWKICCCPCKFCQNVPFYEQNHWQMARSTENFRELSSSDTLSAQKHILSLAVWWEKNTPFLVRFWWKTHPRCWHTRCNFWSWQVFTCFGASLAVAIIIITCWLDHTGYQTRPV